MNNDMIGRYIYAVVRQLPRKIRDDVEKELRGLIEDMLEARCGEISPTEQDLRVVLTELGTPAELAEKYHPDGGRILIGPPYFSKYKLALAIVLSCFAFGITLASIIPIITEPASSVPLFYRFLEWIGSLALGSLNAFAIITLIFAIFQWKNVKLDIPSDNLDSLPPVPQKQQIIRRSEPIAGIIVSVFFAVLFLAAPQIFGIWGAWSGEAHTFFPYFSVEYIHAHWYLIVFVTLFSILADAFMLYEGRYTKRLAFAIVAKNSINAVLYILLLGHSRAVSSTFMRALADLLGPGATFVVNAAAYFRLFLLGIILFSLVLESAIALYRAFRYADD